MAFFIEIVKISEDAHSAEFVFGTDENHRGRFRFDKENSEATSLQECPGDDRQRLLSRAVHKVKQSWQTGVLPEKTCWAS